MSMIPAKTLRAMGTRYDDRDKLYAVYYNGGQITSMMDRRAAYALKNALKKQDKYKIGKLEVK